MHTFRKKIVLSVHSVGNLVNALGEVIAKIRMVAVRACPLSFQCTITREECLTVTKPNLNIYRMYDRPTLKPVGKENIRC